MELVRIEWEEGKRGESEKEGRRYRRGYEMVRKRRWYMGIKVSGMKMGKIDKLRVNVQK